MTWKKYIIMGAKILSLVVVIPLWMITFMFRSDKWLAENYKTGDEE